MPPTNGPNKLTVVIEENDGFLDAQMIELDIAVRAKSDKELLEEIEYAILMEYRMAKKYGRVPFVNLVGAVPERYRKQAERASPESFEKLGDLMLDSDVMEALAIVLHAPKPVFVIRDLHLRHAA